MVLAIAGALAGAAAAEPLAGDGVGCRDKTVAAKLATLEDR
jgi:hypothetical protein